MPKAEELLEKLRSEVALEVLSELRTALDRMAVSYRSGAKVGTIGAGKKSKVPGHRTYVTGQRGIFPKWVAKQEGVKTAQELFQKLGGVPGALVTEKTKETVTEKPKGTPKGTRIPKAGRRIMEIT